MGRQARLTISPLISRGRCHQYHGAGVLGVVGLGWGVGVGGVGEPLCTTVRLWLEALETVSQSSPPPLPQLQLAERGSPP